jgi:D,D-heptose 1,7-bisphosphate phosphatase
MKAVIMAGGKGTRLLPLTGNYVPKSMFPVAGKTLLERQIEMLKANGIREIIIVIGHLGAVIKDALGDGQALNVSIRYFEETEPLGTAGALYFLRKQLQDTFLLVFGDIIFDIDLSRFLSFHKASAADATLFVHPNSHPYDSDLVEMNEHGRVTRFLSKHDARDFWYDNCVNAGLYVFEPAVFDAIKAPERMDLDKDILTPMVTGDAPGTVYAYRSPEYVKDAGTPERIDEIERAIESGVVARKNLGLKQRAVFLDRDGTINKFNGLISQDDQFELENGVARAIRRINDSGFLAVVITNQPGVARGLCGEEDIRRIHRKMQTLLGKSGAYLDAILFCPHHPDKGFPEENPAYKIECACRKPKIGMVTEAAARYNIDLEASWFIGDMTMDILTGRNAGTRTILVLTGAAGEDGKYQATPDFVCENLPDAVDVILKEL